MAAHIEGLLDVILSVEFKDIVDEHGKPVPPSSAIYQTISDIMKNVIKPKYIYVMIHKNRYNLLSKILQFHNISSGDFFLDSKQEISMDDSNTSLEKLLEFKIEFSHKTWVTMDPEEVIYSDSLRRSKRYGTLKRKIWTNQLYKAFHDETKLPCAISFKRCKWSESGIYITVAGSCKECGCKFSGCIINRPMPSSAVIMECSVQGFDPAIEHKKKRQLKGQRRVEVSRVLEQGNQLPCVWRRNEADRLMEFGDDEPPHLPHLHTLRKAKQERKDKILGVTQGIDPLESIHKMKYEQHAGDIHGIGLDPLFVHYWTQEQMAIYLMNPHLVFVDATGSLIKKLKLPNSELSAHIYLYQIVCDTGTSKMPIFQMLSAVQNTNAIQYWLYEILRIGSTHKANFPRPREVVCDFDKALMGSVVRAFGDCKDLRDYLSKCLGVVNDAPAETLPTCFLRLDISHYVALVARWKLFAPPLHPGVKTFYIMTMCLLTREVGFDHFKETIKSIIILCSSRESGKTANGSVSLAEKARVSLSTMIKSMPELSELCTEDTDKSENSQEYVDDEIEKGPLNNSSIDTWAHQFFQDSVNTARSAPIGDDINPYYCPAMAQKIRYMLPYFPLFTGVMISKFQYGEINASSSAVEAEFNDLKHRLLKNDNRPMRIDKFLTTHIRSFSGRAKLAVAADNARRAPFEVQSQRKAENNNTDGYHDANAKVFNRSSFVDQCEIQFDSQIPIDHALTNTANSVEDLTNATDELVDSILPSPSLDTTENRQICELAQEQNWRNKNESKKMKRTYLDPRPDWDAVGLNNKRLSIGLLRNGNLCPMVTYKDTKIVVANTCGFDSIMQILASACRNDRFRELITATESDALKFVQSLLTNGPSNEVYKMRAHILRQIECFIQPRRTPRVIKVDALSNIANLCEYVFHSIPDSSYTKVSTCNICKVTRDMEKKIIAPLDFSGVGQHTFGELAQAILKGTRSWRCCDQECETIVTYGLQIFIECEYLVSNGHSVDDFPEAISLQGRRYTLAGIVMYSGGRSLHSVGHYTAWVKSGAQWTEYDDTKRKPLSSPPVEISKWPQLCIYTYTSSE